MTDDINEGAFETAGTFDGAIRQHSSVSVAALYVSRRMRNRATVRPSAIGDGWHFTPDDARRCPTWTDPDYMRYGFWLKRTTDADGVDHLQRGGDLRRFLDSAPIGSVGAGHAGTADYDGGATGVYVKNVYNTDQTLASATAGFFSADVSLKAYFGGDDVAINKQNIVSGTIDQFVLEHGEDNKWSVALEGDIATTEGTASGTANGGGPAGTFNATFHGALDSDDPTVTPSSVVGEFNANFSDGTAAGGFGARK